MTYTLPVFRMIFENHFIKEMKDFFLRVNITSSKQSRVGRIRESFTNSRLLRYVCIYVYTYKKKSQDMHIDIKAVVDFFRVYKASSKL